MKKLSLKYLVCLGLGVISSATAMGQEQSSSQEQSSDSLNMDVTFTGNQVNVVKSAGKLGNTPKIYESVVEIPTIKYTMIPNKQQAEIIPSQIKPVKVNIEQKLPQIYRGYAKAGFGLYTTPLIDIYYTEGRNRNGVWGTRFEHLSSAGGVAANDSIQDRFSNNEFNLWGRRFLKKHSIEGQFDWKRDVWNYYGWDPDITPIEADALTNQMFNKVGGSVNLKSYYRDTSKVNYEGQVGFFNFRDNFETSENNVDFLAHVRKFNNDELYSMDVHFNFDQLQYIPLDNLEDEKSINNTIFSLTPRVSTDKGDLEASVGFGLWLDFNSSQTFHFYPEFEAEYSLFDDLFIPYAGVSGGLQQNTYQSLTNQNPWMLRTSNTQQDPVDFDNRNTNRKLELFGGIRGTISSSTSFNARVSRTRWEDFVYFVNDSSFTGGNQLLEGGAGNGFTIIYDDLTVTNLSAEVSVNTNKNFKFFAKGDYFLYTNLKLEEEAWYQPSTQLTLSGWYDFREKLIVKLDLFTVGQRKAKSLVPLEADDDLTQSFWEYNLKGYADANLGIEYRYTKRLSAWLQFNNFLAARYEVWKNYPVQRFNAMMGVSYAF